MNTYSINCLDGKNVLVKLSDDSCDDAIADVLHTIHTEFGIEPEYALSYAVAHLTSVQLTYDTLPNDLLNMLTSFWSGCCAAKCQV